MYPQLASSSFHGFQVTHEPWKLTLWIPITLTSNLTAYLSAFHAKTSTAWAQHRYLSPAVLRHGKEIACSKRMKKNLSRYRYNPTWPARCCMCLPQCLSVCVCVTQHSRATGNNLLNCGLSFWFTTALDMSKLVVDIIRYIPFLLWFADAVLEANSARSMEVNNAIASTKYL